MSGSVVVAGLGSWHRRDDAAGPRVAAAAAASCEGVFDVGPLGEPLDLLGLWDGADLAVVVDATSSGEPPGTVSCIELRSATSTGTGGTPTSTHGLGLTGALRLARAVGRAPRRVVVVGIEGQDFGFGEGLSALVEAALPEALRAVRSVIDSVGKGGGPCA